MPARSWRRRTRSTACWRETDPDPSGLLLDTGHAVYGGGDPAGVVRRHGGAHPLRPPQGRRGPTSSTRVRTSDVAHVRGLGARRLLPAGRRRGGLPARGRGAARPRLRGLAHRRAGRGARRAPGGSHPEPFAERASAAAHTCARRSACDERLRVGVVGCGGIAQMMHLPTLAERPGPVRDRRPRRRQQPDARRRGDALSRRRCVTTDPGAVLRRPAGGGGAPPQLRLAPRGSIRAARRPGSHVFVEKPLAFSLRGDRRGRAAARDAAAACSWSATTSASTRPTCAAPRRGARAAGPPLRGGHGPPSRRRRLPHAPRGAARSGATARQPEAEAFRQMTRDGGRARAACAARGRASLGRGRAAGPARGRVPCCS